MSGNYLLSIGIPLISTFFAATFYFSWRQRTRRPHVRDWALAYAFGAVGFSIELLRVYGFGDFASAFSNVFHGAGALLTARGVLRRYGQRHHYGAALWLLYGAGMMGLLYFSYVLPSVIARSASMSLAIGLMLTMAADSILRASARDAIDRVLAGTMIIVALVIIARPAIAFITDMPGQIGAVDPESLFVVALKLQTLVGWVGFAIIFLIRMALDVTRELEDQARRDPMTGLLNRRGFFEKTALDLGQRAINIPCSILIVDIDHFKSINDRFGHATGDLVIREVGAIFSGVPFDPIVARIGGEEFALLLPTTPLKAAALFGEGLRGAIAAWRDGELPDELTVTASIGVAEFRAGGDLGEALRRADIALYTAKRSGRDRIATADTKPEAESRLSIA